MFGLMITIMPMIAQMAAVVVTIDEREARQIPPFQIIFQAIASLHGGKI